MSSKSFYWSDLHLGHSKIYSLPFPSSKDKSRPMRPFKNAEEADDYMITQYNSVVNPGDKVYFLGDVALNKNGLSKMSRMTKGHNFLILGNHDTVAPIIEYTKYFNKIYGLLYLKSIKCILSHSPLHDGFNYNARFDYNIHGHLHDNFISDSKYLNVSVEHLNYKPIEFNELLKLWKLN